MATLKLSGWPGSHRGETFPVSFAIRNRDDSKMPIRQTDFMLNLPQRLPRAKKIKSLLAASSSILSLQICFVCEESWIRNGFTEENIK